MNAFITGSRAYGTPRSDSDIDVVVRIEQPEIDKLKRLGIIGFTTPNNQYDIRSGCQFRTGPLNLICIPDDNYFAAWKRGTEELAGRRPVTRDDAIAHFDKVFDEMHEEIS